VVRAFQRRWVLAVCAGVLLSTVAATGAWLVISSAKYVSRTTLMITTYMPKIIFETAEARSDFYTYQRTQMALIKSRLILDAALREPSVASLPTVRGQEDPVEWLEKAIKLEFPGNSEILELSLSGDRPDDLEVLLNGITDTYMRLVVDAEQKGRLDRLDNLRKLWDRYQDDLRNKRRSLRQLAEAAGSNDKETLVLKQQMMLENISVAQHTLLALRPEMLKAEAEIKQLEAGAKAEPSSAVASGGPEGLAQGLAGSVEEPQIKALKDEIARLDSHLTAATHRVRSPSDPSVMALRQQLLSARRALAARQAKWMVETRGGTAGLVAGSLAPSPLAQAQSRLQVLRIYEEALKQDIERFQGEARSINLSTLDVQMEQDQMALADATARKIGAEVEALDVELRAPPRVKVVDRAKAPRTKDEMKKVKMTGMAGLGAFALGLLGVTFWEFRSRRISSVDEVVRGLQIRLVGTLPAPPSRSGLLRVGLRSAAIEEQSRDRLIESIDATRTMLIHAARSRSTGIVMVTSALKGEGKTTLSSHLATSLARAGRLTLLVDCDFRRPSLHRLFDMSLEPGLSEILRSEADSVEVIRESTAKGLHLITAGRWDAQALQELARERARPIFDRLAKEYDFIIVDSAPVLQVSDTLLLSQQVDAVIFAILRDVSTLPNVQAAYERLDRLGVRMLGAVVNGAQSDIFSYSGYY
jgi:capsular exopolysaccharide synthesis family protein